MKPHLVLSLSLTSLVITGLSITAAGQTAPKQSRLDKFTPHKPLRFEAPAGYFYIEGVTKPATLSSSQEAKTGYDNKTNGYMPQGPDFPTLTKDNAVPLRSMNDDRFFYEQIDTIELGVGPTYNAQDCAQCHGSVVTGGSSQVAEHRTGHTDGSQFFEAPGGSLIQSRATNPDIVEKVRDDDETRTFRLSTNTLGDGYVECIADSTLQAIADAQPAQMRGAAVAVAVLEGDTTPRIGRFGWKDQHGSLASFSADAYLNEVGVTTPFLPDENTSSGTFVGYGTIYDPVPDPESENTDVFAFADFMRSTKAPARGEITPDVAAGERKFSKVGCAICHVSTITTAPAGTVINGGIFIVPDALGDKIIHPFSDFLLHDIGTGDGIPILPTPEMEFTAPLMRTAPLWGLRTRNRLMHDGLSATKMDAISRHAGQAATVVARFNRLDDTDKNQILAFLDSL